MVTQLPLPKRGQPRPQFSAHVCCGQTAGSIKMPLGTEVDLGAGHIVLDGDPAPPTWKGHSSLPLFGPCLLWPSGYRMPLGTKVGLSSGETVLDGDTARSPNHGKVYCLLWPNRWMDQDTTWYGGRSRLRQHCVRWKPSSPKERAQQPTLPLHRRPSQQLLISCCSSVVVVINDVVVYWIFASYVIVLVHSFYKLLTNLYESFGLYYWDL